METHSLNDPTDTDMRTMPKWWAATGSLHDPSTGAVTAVLRKARRGRLSASFMNEMKNTEKIRIKMELWVDRTHKL